MNFKYINYHEATLNKQVENLHKNVKILMKEIEEDIKIERSHMLMGKFD